MVRFRRWRCGLLAVGVIAFSASTLAQQADGLQAALQATLSMHPAVSGKQALVKSREFGSDTARSQRYPSITAQAQQYSERAEDVTTGENLATPASLRARRPLPGVIAGLMRAGPCGEPRSS